jgi:hypothetical protein
MYVTEVVAENVRFIGPRREDERVERMPLPTPPPEREVVAP